MNIDTDVDWTEITPDDEVGYPSGFSAILGTSTIVLNKGSYILVSYDRGDNWIELDKSHDRTRGWVSFLDRETGYTLNIPDWYDPYNIPCDSFFLYNGSPLAGMISRQPLDVLMNISPNPVSESLNVSFNIESPMENLLLIHDTRGKLLYKINTGRVSEYYQETPVAGLAPGTYILTLTNSNGSRSMKFIKL
ncbi:MAG: T9SS type A sorting domain-containing protein [Saprospiraceae bacterium]|nr:T9SS type A sorting domain-containing protein [Saprospiraceae bacterium]